MHTEDKTQHHHNHEHDHTHEHSHEGNSGHNYTHEHDHHHEHSHDHLHTHDHPHSHDHSHEDHKHEDHDHGEHHHDHAPSSSIENDEKTLRVLLVHWINHNRSHQDNFQQWVDKAKTMNRPEVSAHIQKAIEYMELANESLIEAKKHM